VLQEQRHELFESTTRVALEIIRTEQQAREEKTARLRKARLEKEKSECACGSISPTAAAGKR
jgi:hypothetical protein